MGAASDPDRPAVAARDEHAGAPVPPEPSSALAVPVTFQTAVEATAEGPVGETERAAAAAAFDALTGEARRFAQASRAEATWEAYRGDWEHFAAWCARYDRTARPAAPETVAGYLTAHAPRLRPATATELATGHAEPDPATEGATTGNTRRVPVVDGQIRTGLKPPTLRRRLAAIAVAHRLWGHDDPSAHPMVRAVLAGIAREPAAAGRRQATAATPDPLAAMLAPLRPHDDPRDARDAAVLLLGMTGALRRSELAALRLGDLNVSTGADRIEVTVRRSKTDQEAHGHILGLPDPEDLMFSPRAALDTWLGWLRQPRDPTHPTRRQLTDQEPLWRPICRDRGGVPRRRIVDHRSLGARSIAEIVTQRAADVGLEGQWSGHSMRRGFATAAYAAGVDEVEIMRHGRWSSSTVMRSYLEDGTRFRASHPVPRLFPPPPQDTGR